MSFPGYLKSLNLINRRSDTSENESRSHDISNSRSQENQTATQIVSGNSKGSKEAQQIPKEETILDERGKPPSKSLWVGNIPSRTTSSGLRVLFNKFGHIVSTRVLNKCAFVNFEMLESAIAAWREYHDQDIFNTGDQTINIRFTGTIADTKQGNDVRERRSSISAKAEAAQKQWFQPVDNNTNTNTNTNNSSPTQSSNGIEWPNGKPPTGPRSQRREVSPPSLRRGDSYRPAESSRKDSYRSEYNYRRSDRDDHYRGRDYRRRSNQHYSPEHSLSHSPSSSSTSSGNTSPKRTQSRGDGSPLPWERKRGRKQMRLECTDRSEGVNMNASDMSFAETSTESETIQRHVAEELEEKHSEKEDGSLSPPSVRLKTPEIGPQIRLPYTDSPDMSAYSPSMEINGNCLSVALISRPKQISKSPSLRPIDRVRGENGYSSGSPGPSEVATTSSRASTRRRKCYDCKKAPSDLAPLTSCSKCTRRFHSGCGKPRPSSCLDKSKYVCERCLRNCEKGVGEVSASTATKPPSKLHGKVHLISPPLSLDQDGSGSANLSPRDDLSHLLSIDKRFESFFPKQTEIVDIEAAMGLSENRLSPQPHQLKRNFLATLHLAQPTPTSPVSPSTDDQSAFDKKNKYKVITCKWWASNSCTQVEDGCYYAHRQTGITFPDRKRPNKNWTCYNWLHNSCTLSERDCLHAHKDTGLHVWRDGRPSFKHVTCFWWLKGRCRWDSESCKLAHEDTGLYSLDPSEKWQGGMKFSTVHPSEGQGRSSQHRRHTELSISSTRPQPTNGPAHYGEGMSEESTDTHENNTTLTNGAKPSLTINTGNNSSIAEQDRSVSTIWQFPSSIGAPPQTPNEDSPNKAYAQGLNSQTTFKFPLRVPDLPTPGIEEPTVHEQAMRDYVDQISGKALSEPPVDDLLPRDAASVKMRDAHSSVYPVHSSPASHQTSIPNTPDLAEVSDNQSRDPRLARREYVVEPTTDVVMEDDGAREMGEHQLFEAYDVHLLARTNSGPNDDAPRRGVKKCQKCSKPVFGTDICRVCNSKTDTSNNINSLVLSEKPSVEVSNTDEGVGKITTTTNIPTGDVNQVVDLTKAQTTSKTPLKRSAPGSNMFLKNKRPKSSMIFSSSGSIRPDSFTREPTGKRTHTHLANQDSRREHQTLEDLILKEREKNNKKRTDLGVTAREVYSSLGEGGKENEIPSSPDKLYLAESSVRHQAICETEVTTEISQEKHHISDVSALFSSPTQLVPEDRQVAPKVPVTAKDTLIPGKENPQIAKDHTRTSYVLSHWRSSQSPRLELEARVQSAFERNPTTVSEKIFQDPPHHPFTTKDRNIQSSPERKKPSMPHRLSSRDVVVSPEKFSWASAITCTQCQKHHKKCLHDDSGRLSAVKCREYVLSRSGKPDTGRSRHEWNAILESSELDPDSDDDDLLEDEESQSAKSAYTGESEDEFATAIDGNELAFEGPSDEHEILLERFKRPPLQEMHLSPARQSRPSISKFFITNKTDHWTIADEELKKRELQKKGVMFESDSEDEDYLSDTYELPLKEELPIDPLCRRPCTSRNLFAVAPELDHKHTLQQEGIRRPFQPRPSRKVQWAELRQRQLQGRRERFGNPHWEVDRKHLDVMVMALVERIVPPQNLEDRFAIGSVQKREEKISFRDFLGAPKLPEICLMNDGDKLAFRDGQKERDRTFGRTGRGLGKPTTDEEKWPVRGR